MEGLIGILLMVLLAVVVVIVVRARMRRKSTGRIVTEDGHIEPAADDYVPAAEINATGQKVLHTNMRLAFVGRNIIPSSGGVWGFKQGKARLYIWRSEQNTILYYSDTGDEYTVVQLPTDYFDGDISSRRGGRYLVSFFYDMVHEALNSRTISAAELEQEIGWNGE